MIEFDDDAAHGRAHVEPIEDVLLGADLLHHVVVLRLGWNPRVNMAGAMTAFLNQFEPRTP